MASKPKDYAAYAVAFPDDVRRLLDQLRAAIREVAPKAEETISYGMPAFRFNDHILVWFGAHTKHVGLYPRVSAMVAFEKELAHYKHAKGSVQFPVGQPLPVPLIERIVRFRLKELL